MFRTISNPATRRTQMLRATLAAVALATVAGCGHKAPTGQTVATVNGEDITQSELNMELAAAGVQPKDKAKAQPQILQMMVDRKLLVQDAIKSGVDKQPEVVLAERRGRETLLAQRSIEQLAAGSRQPPTPTDVNDFLDKHPAIGSARRVFVIDQLKFPTPTSQAEADAFKPIKTMDQLIAMLAGKGLRTERDRTEVDSATLPDDAYVKLNATKSGEPLVVIRGPIAVANVVVGEHPAATGGAEAEAIAKQRIQAQRFEASVKQRQASLRSGAKIDYAAGFAPPPTKK